MSLDFALVSCACACSLSALGEVQTPSSLLIWLPLTCPLFLFSKSGQSPYSTSSIYQAHSYFSFFSQAITSSSRHPLLSLSYPPSSCSLTAMVSAASGSSFFTNSSYSQFRSHRLCSPLRATCTQPCSQSLQIHPAAFFFPMTVLFPVRHVFSGHTLLPGI